MPINAPTPRASQMLLIALAAIALACIASRIKPKTHPAATDREVRVSRTDWGYINEAKSGGAGKRLLVHVIDPPSNHMITVDVPRSAVRSCTAKTNAVTPLRFESNGEQKIAIALPERIDAAETVIELDLITSR